MRVSIYKKIKLFVEITITSAIFSRFHLREFKSNKNKLIEMKKCYYSWNKAREEVQEMWKK